MLYDREDILMRQRPDRYHSGKAAEGRKYGVSVPKIEARELQGLFGSPVNPDTGMDMTGKAIVGRGFLGVQCFDIMYKQEIPDPQFLLAQIYRGSLVPAIVEDIVIASDKPDDKIGKVGPPFLEEGQFLVFSAVKKIPDDQQLAGLKILYLCHQPLEVIAIDRGRHGDARFAEMPGLAEMQVGYDQRFFFFPEDTAVGG